MAVLVGTITNEGRRRQAESSIGPLAGFPSMDFVYFKIGEGGWLYDGIAKVPKAPSPALTDIEADGTPGNSFFQKIITTDKVLFIGPSTAKVSCELDLTEGNDNGFGDPPQYFEIGLFDSTGTLLVYATFPEETKSATKILRHHILAVF